MGQNPTSCPLRRSGCEPGVESESRGKNNMEDQEYTNPFVEVHKKAKAFKDRANEANKNDAELRKSRAIQEANDVFKKEHVKSD